MRAAAGVHSHNSAHNHAEQGFLHDLHKLGAKLQIKARGHHLTAVVKLNLGLFHDVSDKDIEAVFDFLDEDKSGSLQGEEVKHLLQNALTPPCTDADVAEVLQAMGKSSDDKLSIDDLKSMMNSGTLKAALARLHKERDLDAKKQAEKVAAGPQITRELWTERIRWRVSRDDSFYTLPYTIIFIAVFIFIVVTHLQIFERQRLQGAIEEWVDGFGENYPGPYLEEHVGSKQQMLEWMNQSGLPLLFSSCHIGPRGHECPVAPRSVLVGDARIVQKSGDAGEQSMWLLHSPEAEAHLALKPLGYQDAARKRLTTLWDWVDDDVESLEMIFTTYCDALETFAVTQAMLKIGLDGVVVGDCICRAINIHPYAKWTLYIYEGVYLFMLWYAASLEFRTYRMRGCIGYWDHGGIEGFWNAVDLFGLAMGITNIVQWALYVSLAHSDEIHSVLRKEDGQFVLKNGAMRLAASEIETLEDQLMFGSRSLFLMQIAMATNVLSIMGKLFKSFGANARLQLVTDTLFRSSVDMFHFGVVFGAIFIAFALIAHILFGEDFQEFRSFEMSINTLFETLLGDFDWFSSGVVSNKGLGSGMPFWVVVGWFYFFMVFVVLVMMNMLLAIVMDHYMTLLTHVKSDPDNAPTLWKQSRRMYERLKGSKGFMNNLKVLYEMTDKKPAGHPEEIVSQASLEKAFPQMPEKQVETLIKWMKTEAEKRSQQNAEPAKAENIRLLHEIQGEMTSLTDQVRIVTHSACENYSSLDVLEARFEKFLKEEVEKKEAKTIRDLQDCAYPPESPARRKAHTELPALVAQVKKFVEQNKAMDIG